MWRARTIDGVDGGGFKVVRARVHDDITDLEGENVWKMKNNLYYDWTAWDLDGCVGVHVVWRLNRGQNVVAQVVDGTTRPAWGYVWIDLKQRRREAQDVADLLEGDGLGAAA